MPDSDLPQQTERLESSSARSTLAGRFSRAGRPELLFALLITVIYLPSLFQPFILDDFRALAYFQAYESGQRDSLDLYLLAKDREQIIEDKLTNYSPWWIFDDFHLRYFRPVSELVLYGEYKLFGSTVTGYRAVGLLLYILSVSLVYRLYRSWLGDESLARWSALVYALAVCNAVPVVFISAQCDLLALASCLAAMLLITRFIKGQGWRWLLLGLGCYALGMGSKEAALPTCILPLALVPLLIRRENEQRKAQFNRILGSTALLLVMALGFVAFYSSQHYGSNGLLMINPLRNPLEYLKMMPVHVLMLLSGWILQTNPIFTYLQSTNVTAIAVFCLLGALAMMVLVVILWRQAPRHQALPAFGFWALAFMPLLACNNPDNRVLMLPMVGLAVILGVWLTGRTSLKLEETSQPVNKVKWLPLLIFVIIAANTQILNYWALAVLEVKTANEIRQVAAGFDRPATREDTIFLINSSSQLDMLWNQYRADYVLGKDSPRIRYLTHLLKAEWERIDDHTLRITAPGTPYFQSYLARVGMTQEKVPLGKEFDAGEFTATIAAVNAENEVTAVDFRFKKPLDSESYQFFDLNFWHPPQKIDVNAPPVAE